MTTTELAAARYPLLEAHTAALVALAAEHPAALAWLAAERQRRAGPWAEPRAERPAEQVALSEA